MIYNGSSLDRGVSDLVKPQTFRPAFIIQDPPSASQNLQLALDMLDQDQHRRSKDTSLCALHASNAGGLRGGINSEGNVGFILCRSISECMLNRVHRLGSSVLWRPTIQNSSKEVTLSNILSHSSA